MDQNRINLLLSAGEELGFPFFAYDVDKMTAQYERLVNAFDKRIDLNIQYACKALSNQAILTHFKRLGAGLDTVSIQEILQGLNAGYKAEDIIYTPNGVSWSEISSAIDLDVKINIDNLIMLERIGSSGLTNTPICIRINPHITAGGNSKIQVGHIDSKFGISIHQLPHVLRIVEEYNLIVEGVHMHTGSDIVDIDSFIMGCDLLLEVAKKFKDLKYIDFGSGFKVPYKEGDSCTDIEAFGKTISARFLEFLDEYFALYERKNLQLAFEPGKYLVSEAGVFLCKTNTIKQTTSAVFAAVDSGFNHFIRPMFYDSYHEIVNISNPQADSKMYTVVGYICETDTFGWNRKIAEIREDDVLLIKNAGAYVSAMASNYNSRLRPAEVILKNKSWHLIRRREEMSDLYRNQIDVSYLYEASDELIEG